MTHYIPFFAIERSAGVNPSGRSSRQLASVCGAWIPTSEHTTEPTCPTCRGWLEQAAADDLETMAALRAEDRNPEGRS